MFAVGDPEEGLPEPVFYTDGRRASELGPVTLPRRLVYVAGLCPRIESISAFFDQPPGDSSIVGQTRT